MQIETTMSNHSLKWLILERLTTPTIDEEAIGISYFAGGKYYNDSRKQSGSFL